MRASVPCGALARGVLGDGRHRHGNSLDHSLDVPRRGLQLVADVGLDAVWNRFQVHQEVDEVAIPGVGGHPPGRGVRLGQIAEVRQLGELAADGGRRKIDEVTRLQRLRSDRHSAGRELVHDRPEDCLLSVFHLVSALSERECQIRLQRRQGACS